MITNYLLIMGSFDPLLQLFRPFLEDANTFCQSIAILLASVMVVVYKLRQMFAEAQQDQMFDQKSKAVLIALVFIFVVPTIVKVLQSYFV
ncbi:hypothetical protein [Thomasclavelia cocleata]|uniref:hypothetical protein n=1 Tax=Thomasclavelia cocleata TaxID=69824 RepID=UPI0024324856|nr:hypothetical protein [Thomasclavelia cocleata]